MSENGEISTAGKNFTLPQAVTALTNFISATIKSKPLKKQILRTRNHDGNDDNAGLNAPYHVATGNAIYIGRTQTLSFTLSSPGLMCKCAHILTDTFIATLRINHGVQAQRGPNWL